MTRRSRFATLTIALLTLLVASVPGCGKSSTNPGGGGVPKELDSGNIADGGQYAHTFNTAGTYHYCCNIHGCTAMHANVIVANGNPASATVNITGTFFPGDVSVAPAGTVTWHNTSGTTHTVTSN